MVSCFSYYIVMKKTLAFAFACIFCVVFAFSVSVKKIKAENPIVKSEEYKAVLELWSIDTFEGGKGSRRDFLLKTTLKFEKKHKGVIISVLSYSPYEAEEAIKTRIPDIVSCGAGLDFFIPYVQSVSFSSKYKTLSIGKKNYGISWCYGGYVLIGTKKTLAVGQGKYNDPLKGLGERVEDFEKVDVYSPKEAYSRFLKGDCSLLGTQRDIYRLSNKGMDFEYEVLNGFSDLFQNMFITCAEKEKFEFCESFLSYMLSDETQERLTEIGMLSVTKNNLYNGTLMEKLEKITIENFTSFFKENS